MRDGVTDGGVFDICGTDLWQLRDADDSSLTRAVDRILSKDNDDACASFHATIGRRPDGS